MDHTQESNVTRPFTAVEFCAGYQGIHLGLKRAIPGLHVVAVSEIEAFAIANMVSKMESGHLDPAPIWPDLKTFPNKEFHGKVDLLVAGFPCQPFSAAGKRNGDEDPRHLFPYIKQSCIDMQPEFVFLENVEGIISSKLSGDGWADPAGTPVLLHVLRELERVGYTATAGVFSAAEVGAPHQRKRVFILAKRSHVPHSDEQRREVPAEREHPGKQQPECYGTNGPPWPSRPGEHQYDWEPPRVVSNTNGPHGGQQRLHPRNGSDRRVAGNIEQPEEVVPNTKYTEPRGLRSRDEAAQSGPTELSGDRQPAERQAQPPMGGDLDGLTDRLDYAELYESCDNSTDELRLLGNGVVPETAHRAWVVLSERLMK